MATDEELRCVISDLMDQVRERDAELATLRARFEELEKDRERLDFVLRCGPILLVETDESGRLLHSWDDIETREDVDAACAKEPTR